MRITVELPNDLANHTEPAREALEALAVSGYRSGDLSGFQAARILGYDSRFEFEEFLKLRGIYEHAYTASDLAEDLNSLNNLKLPPDANNSR